MGSVGEHYVRSGPAVRIILDQCVSAEDFLPALAGLVQPVVPAYRREARLRLNNNVGSKKMKYFIIVIVIMLMQIGCRKAEENRDVSIFVNTNNAIRLGPTIVSVEILDSLLERAAPVWSNAAFVVCLSSGSVSNSLPFLMMAEKHGITNFCVRTKQIFPPIKPDRPVAIY